MTMDQQLMGGHIFFWENHRMTNELNQKVTKNTIFFPSLSHQPSLTMSRSSYEHSLDINGENEPTEKGFLISSSSFMYIPTQWTVFLTIGVLVCKILHSSFLSLLSSHITSSVDFRGISFHLLAF
jgi:hypothetical protein